MLPDLIKQLPPLKKKYVKHEAYKNQTIEDVFEPETLSKSQVQEVKTLRSSVFMNKDNGFLKVELPFDAQISQVFASYVDDLDQDGDLDIILAGNQTKIKPELGSNNASYGLVLIRKEEGYIALSLKESGIFVPNETRQIKKVTIAEKEVFLFIRNNEKSLAFELN